MRHHLKHLLMCSPMILIGIVLLASGAGVAALIPIAFCVLMMGAMMSAMSSDRDHSR